MFQENVSCKPQTLAQYRRKFDCRNSYRSMSKEERVGTETSRKHMMQRLDYLRFAGDWCLHHLHKKNPTLGCYDISRKMRKEAFFYNVIIFFLYKLDLKEPSGKLQSQSKHRTLQRDRSGWTISDNCTCLRWNLEFLSCKLQNCCEWSLLWHTETAETLNGVKRQTNTSTHMSNTNNNNVEF